MKGSMSELMALIKAFVTLITNPCLRGQPALNQKQQFQKQKQRTGQQHHQRRGHAGRRVVRGSAARRPSSFKQR